MLRKVFSLAIISILILTACGTRDDVMASFQYTLESIHKVNGRQGVCTEDGYYWVSGSTSLTKYDEDWNVIAENTDPFKGYDIEVNHIGDIDVYQGELYLGVEYFMDGVGRNIQVAVYDGDTLELKRVFPFKSDTGQIECSGIAVNEDDRIVYMSSWVDDPSSSYLYMYDLDNGGYKGRLQMNATPKWIQGVAYFDGSLYITADDGDADKDEPDNMYRIDLGTAGSTYLVSPEHSFVEVTRQGEIEGLTFDKVNNKFLLLYNRGARIVLGMPKGFYDGYNEEIHEVFVYNMMPAH
ncbi:MAG: hypothetical protein IKQ71_07490 [Lachnospiraceae bacterium]|nr:hypothetical protein [Lachnospiraceae bacterium]